MENWEFLAQQCLETLLGPKSAAQQSALIVLADQQPPLSHDLVRLESLAGARLPKQLLESQDFAVKARDSPQATPPPAPREQLLALIRQLRAELEQQRAGQHSPLPAIG